MELKITVLNKIIQTQKDNDINLIQILNLKIADCIKLESKMERIGGSMKK